MLRIQNSFSSCGAAPGIHVENTRMNPRILPWQSIGVLSPENIHHPRPRPRIKPSGRTREQKLCPQTPCGGRGTWECRSAVAVGRGRRVASLRSSISPGARSMPRWRPLSRRRGTWEHRSAVAVGRGRRVASPQSSISPGARTMPRCRPPRPRRRARLAHELKHPADSPRR